MDISFFIVYPYLAQNFFALYKSRFLFILILVFAITFLQGCVFYSDIQISNIHNVELVKFENDGLVIEADVKVVNPNFFDIEVVDSDLQVFLEEDLLGNAKILEQFKIAGKSDEIRHIKLKTIYKGKMTGSMRGLFGIAMGKAMNITIKGNVRGKAIGFESDYYLELKETIQL